MLGTRTKQINSYGKRSRRVVDVTSEHNHPGPKEIVSIFGDMPPPPPLAPLTSKMKNRENSVPKKGPSVKVVGLQKKKRLSPVLSPIKRTTRVIQLLETSRDRSLGADLPLAHPTSKPITSRKKQDANKIPVSPPRAPLSVYPMNAPGSPAVIGRFYTNKASGKGIQLSKPFSPYVDVEIITLDGEGRTIREERRVSRNHVGKKITTTSRTTIQQTESSRLRSTVPLSVDSDSESDAISQPRRHKRLARRPHTVILSDDSRSDTDESTPPSPVRELETKSEPSNWAGKAQAFEIAIPPAPYPIHLPQTVNILTGPLSTTPPKLHTFPQHIRHRSPADLLVSSPIPRARQLTPIRGLNRARPVGPPSPPSPFTLADFDLSIDFSNLSLDLLPQDRATHGAYKKIPEYLKPLLEECHQEDCGPHEFSAFIDTFPFDSILQTSRTRGNGDLKFRKIGEASYSEVFGIGDVVLKVVPLRDQSLQSDPGNPSQGKLKETWNSQILSDRETDGPAPTDAKDVQKEIVVTRAMGEVYGGFVKLLKTYVVKGKYPEVLLNLWDDYNERKGSESVRPDTFTLSQIYAIIVLPNGGPDLEAYTFTNASRVGWRKACSIFWQVTKALAHAEHLVSFEHRDLHWGQILVKNFHSRKQRLTSVNLNQRSKQKTGRVSMDDLEHGVQATIIDLGLSRMDAGDGSNESNVQWTPFDEEVFMGEGDYQFDIYRLMKDLTADAWEGYHPMTNVMWLHYLTNKLLYSKGLKPPIAPRKGKGALEASESSFTEKDCYDCLVDVDTWLGRCIASVVPAVKTAMKGKARRKTTPSTANQDILTCAGEIVAYGIKKGWINASILF